MTPQNNVANWFALLWGACMGIFGFWQLRKGIAYGDMGGRFERRKNPIVFWVVVVGALGASGFCIGMAITHWH